MFSLFFTYNMWKRGYNRKKFGLAKRSAILNKHKSFGRRRNINEYFYNKSSLNWQNKVLLYFFVVVFIYLLYFFLFSNYFKIDNVIIEGNTRINTIDIENIAKNALSKRRFLIFKNNNYFLFSPSTIIKELTKNNVLEELIIKRRYFSTIFIYIKEKETKAVYLINDNYELIDKEGVVISKVDKEDKEVKNIEKILIREIPKIIIENQAEIDEQLKNAVKDNPIYQNTSSTVFVSEMIDDKLIIKEVPRIQEIKKDVYPEVPDLGKTIFLKENIEKIFYIDESFQNKFPNIKIIEYLYEFDKTNIITVVLDTGVSIYFKLDENLESQVSNLYKYVIENKNELKNIKYVDLKQKDQLIIK